MGFLQQSGIKSFGPTAQPKSKGGLLQQAGIKTLSAPTPKAVQPTAPITPIASPTATPNPVPPKTNAKPATGFLGQLASSLSIGIERAKGNIKNTAALIVSKLEDESKKSEAEFRKRAQENPKIYNSKFFAEREKQIEGFGKKAQQIRDSAQKSFDKAKDIKNKNIPVDSRTFLERAKDPKWLALTAAESIPGLLASIGVSAGVGLATKNPIAGFVAGFGSSFSQEAGSAYQDAKEFGADKKTAENVAVKVGMASGLLEMLPIAKLLDRTPGGEGVKKGIIKEITKKILLQSSLEAGTESLQQIVSNAVAKTYDHNREVFEGVPESALVGGILGGGAEAVGVSIDNVRGDTKAITNEANAKAQSSTLPQVETAKNYTSAQDFADSAYSASPKDQIGLIDAKKITSRDTVGVGTKEYAALKSDIQKNGITEPVRLTYKNGKLVTTDGSQRVAIAKELGVKVPAIVNGGGVEGLKTIEGIYAETTTKRKAVEDFVNSKKAKLRSPETVKEDARMTKSAELTQHARTLEERYRKLRQQNPDWSDSNAVLTNLRKNIDSTLKQAQELRMPKTEKFRLKDDFEKLTGASMTDSQESELIKLNKELFGDADIKVVGQVLANKDALGSYKDGIIKVVAGQVDAKATLYHESVHKYLDSFLTKDEHIDLLLAAQEKHGIDDFSAVEEKVAEDFINYAKNKEGFAGKLKLLFEKVLTRLKSYLGNVDKIDKLYQDILSGKAAKPKREVGVARSQLPVGQGDTRVSKLEARMKGVIGDATPEQIEQLGLTTYRRMNDKQTIKDAAEYVTNNPQDALRVLSGEIEPPQGIIRNAIYVAMVNAAEGDLTLQTKLASISSTRYGQEIEILKNINKDSEVTILSDIIKVREEAFANKYGKKPAKELAEKVVKTIKSKVKAPDKYDWSRFIDSIDTC